jgi:hypothetical protein
MLLMLAQITPSIPSEFPFFPPSAGRRNRHPHSVPLEEMVYRPSSIAKENEGAGGRSKRWKEACRDEKISLILLG